MSKISEIGMAENDLGRWRALERQATMRAAKLHGDLRAIADALGISGIADETLLRGAILEEIAKRRISPKADMPAEHSHLPQPGVSGASCHRRDVQGEIDGLESAKRGEVSND